MSTVILFYTEVLAIKLFPAGKFNQKNLVWISAGKIVPIPALLEAFGSVWQESTRTLCKSKWAEHVPSLTAPELV